MAVLDIHINDAFVAMAAVAPSPRAIAANGRPNMDGFPTLTTITDAAGCPAVQPCVAGQPFPATWAVTVAAA
jgi:hypothetical protein